MKLKNIFAIMALSLCFTACSDDDEPVINGEDTEVVVKELLGDYIGVKNVILKGDFSPKIHHVAQLLPSEDKGEYKLVLPYEIEGTKAGINESRHGEMPTVVLDDVELTKEEDGTYTYTDDEEVVGSGDSEVVLTNVEVVINGTAMKISWKAQPKGMPIALTYTFEGDKNEKIIALPGYATDLIKSYAGVNITVVGSEKSEPDSSVVKVYGQNNGKFTVRLPKSTGKKEGKGMEMPIVEVKDVEFTVGADNTYTFTKDKMEVPTSSFVVSLEKLNLTIKGNDMDFTFNMKPGSMPMWINNIFSTHYAEEQPEVPEVPEVTVDAYKMEGYFVGNNVMSMGGKEVSTMKDFALTVRPQDNKTITLHIANFTFGNMPFPAIDLKDIEVAVAEDSTYTFTADSKELEVAGMTIKLSNVKGSVKGDKLNVTYSATPGAMPSAIDFAYEGTKQAEPVNPDATAADVLPGSFLGMNATSMVEMPNEEPELGKAFIEVIAQKDGKFSIQLPEAVKEDENGSKMSMPRITVKDLEAAKGEDGVFTISLAKVEFEVVPGKKALVTDLKASFTQGGKATLAVKVKFGAMPLTVAYDFKGYKEAK